MCSIPSWGLNICHCYYCAVVSRTPFLSGAELQQQNVHVDNLVLCFNSTHQLHDPAWTNAKPDALADQREVICTVGSTDERISCSEPMSLSSLTGPPAEDDEWLLGFAPFAPNVGCCGMLTDSPNVDLN